MIPSGRYVFLLVFKSCPGKNRSSYVKTVLFLDIGLKKVFFPMFYEQDLFEK